MNIPVPGPARLERCTNCTRLNGFIEELEKNTAKYPAKYPCTLTNERINVILRDATFKYRLTPSFRAE